MLTKFTVSEYKKKIKEKNLDFSQKKKKIMKKMPKNRFNDFIEFLFCFIFSSFPLKNNFENKIEDNVRHSNPKDIDIQFQK